VIMPCWSDGEGGGEIHQTLSRHLGAGNARGDLLCFASVGNTARRHWSGPFHANGKGYHEWTTGASDNPLTPWGEEEVSVELCCPLGATYEITIYDSAKETAVARSVASEGKGRGGAVVHFLPQSDRTYHVRVRLVRGKAGLFHCVALHSELEYATANGSICFPADGPEVIAVGAVNKQGQRAAYSACGPNSGQPKPDLVAPVPFLISWPSRPGKGDRTTKARSPGPGKGDRTAQTKSPVPFSQRSFSGTSAAAPQAAGLAALLWSRNPDWTAKQIRRTLEKSARDLGPVGHDYETGYGLIQLPLKKVDSR
jgi:hypothetical protein